MIFLTGNKTEDDAIETALMAACKVGEDWFSPGAYEARTLTEEAGWTCDFTTWSDALDFFRNLRAADAA